MGVAGSRPLRRRLHNSCQTKWGGGHCCEANISAMCLIRLCGIKSRIPGTRINTDRQTDRQRYERAGCRNSACVCPHYLCPDQTFKALLSLAVILSRPPIISNGGWSPTWLADCVGPSRRQAEQEQNLGQHSSSATRTTRVLRQLKVRESPAICSRGWRWGGGGGVVVRTVFIVNE